MMKSCFTMLLALLCAPLLATAQVCDESTPPSGLTATYTPGTGALLQWTAVPFSAGVQLSATSPSGASVKRKLFGSELNQFLVPDAFLEDGVYTWRVQAACSATFPYNTTPISPPSTFTVGASGTCPATVTDVDGHVYPVVEIGAYCITAKNLEVRSYTDGTPITEALTDAEWTASPGGAYCFVDDDSSNTATYGLLYNWAAATHASGLCPVGWHVPSEADWFGMLSAVGSAADAGGDFKATGTLEDGTGLWSAPNLGATNSSQFSGIPAGRRSQSGTYINAPEGYGYWWTSTEALTLQAFVMELEADDTRIDRHDLRIEAGVSVRCVQD